MKKETHPEWYPEAKVIVNGEVVMTVGSTVPEMNVEIWSGTHPFFTGQQRLVDTEGQVDRFMRRLQKREEIMAAQEEQIVASSPESMPLQELELGRRAEAALLDAGILTVGDLAAKYNEGGDDALLAIVGVGQMALIDIKKHLRAQGLAE
ncbi:MAG: 50S ribosomal protein L31 [Anaerolineales bacterium]|nr:50S ribosomal protein L31 [Anaerolineales bacterium]